MRELGLHIPKARLLTDAVSRLAFGTDASMYRLLPKLVVKVISEQEVVQVLKTCFGLKVPVTFRAAGTSLSGQALSDSVLVQIGPGFRAAQVLEGGRRIRLQPAVIGSEANRRLAPYGRKIGPDPASIDAAMIGGIAANNASGMCCGVSQNCYRTLDSLRMVLSDGTVLDTSDPASRSSFAASHPGLLQGLLDLSRRINGQPDLRSLISRKYLVKNTTGYGLNALVDFSDPFDILPRLLIGSEGTLGFISSLTLHTVPDPKWRAAALVGLADADSVGRAVRLLAERASHAVPAVELMDAASLRAVAGSPQIAALGEIDAESYALLIDIRAEDSETLEQHREEVRALLKSFPAIVPPYFTASDAQYHSLWKLRKGLYPTVGAKRPSGTTLLIEDIALPMDRLAEGLVDLRRLLKVQGYPEAIIYGHALAGNLHFVFWPDFSRESEVLRYADFMEKLADLVVGKYGGSLKAEHGTGRNMAPFVEKEWGREAYAIMQSIKTLFDPPGILNPDVVLSQDPRIHLNNLKPFPAADPLVDKCTECGFCESACPSRDATLTPRQRIVVWREIARLTTLRSDRPRLRSLVRGFAYQGNETCATDGLCAVQCPVDINTGSLVKEIRRIELRGWQRWVGKTVAGDFATALAVLRLALRVLQGLRLIFGRRLVDASLDALGRLSRGVFPPGMRYLPAPGKFLRPQAARPGSAKPGALRILYLPGCLNRLFGPAQPGDPPLSEALLTLFRRAGYAVSIPPEVDGLCCGLPFASKGMADLGASKAAEVKAAWDRHGQGCAALVCDMSPCTQQLRESLGNPDWLHDAVGFMASHILPRLEIRKAPGQALIFPTCSVIRMGLSSSLRTLAEACAEKVASPAVISCCGVAGDRIFTTPELPRAACASLRTTSGRADEMSSAGAYSSSRTCEIGLSAFGGAPYRSILYLLLEASDPLHLNPKVLS
ncbi:MAG: FAD-binding oxidoreductase [Fibrobacterota bacterium]|nr:FAD-binding oxidoreductase [Fibrobacterota bacterium]